MKLIKIQPDKQKLCLAKQASLSHWNSDGV